ncbi:MAG: DNRLRE domain-containing protein, partial [Halanaerobiales bacterium]|nr:DNRLRE domain-containing protein [Halanaerobiales bacterium]
MKKNLWLIVFIMISLIWPLVVHATETNNVNEPSSVEEDETAPEEWEVMQEEPEDPKVKIKEEIKEKRNVISKHFLNNDGTMTALIYQSPIHFKKDERWEEIDTRIVDLNSVEVEAEIGKEKKEKIKKEGFSYGVFKNSFNLLFSKVSKQPQRFAIEEGWISFQPINGQAVQGQFSDNEVIYKKVWNQTDLKYISRTTGLKEQMILNGPGHPLQFSFRIQLHNLTYEQTENGEILLYDENEQVQAIIPLGYMIDANEEISNEVEMTLEKRGKNLILTIVPDVNWLQADDRAYPIIIDPTIEKDISVGQDAYISNHSFNTIKRGEWERLEVGMNKYYGWKTQHSLLQFDVSQIPDYAIINKAQAQLYMFDAPDTDLAKVQIWEVANSWSESSITWDNQPGKEDYYRTLYVNSTINEFKPFELKLDWIKDWILNPSSNYGVFLYTIDEGKQTLKHFRSKEYEYSSKWPRLYIEYNADLKPKEPTEGDVLKEISTFKIESSDLTYTVSNLSATVGIQEIDISGNALRTIDTYSITIINNSFTISGLSLGTGRYSWKVSDNNVGSWGPEGTFYIDQDPPVPPEGGWNFTERLNITGEVDAATLTNIQNGTLKLIATLSWNQLIDEGIGFKSANLRYKKDDGNWISIEGDLTNTSIDLDVNWYSTYQIQIKGVDDFQNESTWYDLGSFKTPPKPSNLTAEFAGPDEIVVNFEHHGLTDGYNIRWFAVEDPDNDKGETGWMIKSSNPGTISYTYSNYNFTAGRHYQFSIATKHDTTELWVSTDPIEAPNTPPSTPTLFSPGGGVSLNATSVRFLAFVAGAKDMDGDQVDYSIKVQNVLFSLPVTYLGNVQHVFGDLISRWSIEANVPLSNGEYIWWVEASDEIDFTESVKRKIFIDTLAPAEPVFTIISQTTNPAEANSIGVTSDPNIQIRLDQYNGEYPDGYPYPSDTLKLNDVKYFKITSGLATDPLIINRVNLADDDTINYTLGSEGKYDITVKSYDKADNYNSSTKSVTLDYTKPPTITFPNALSNYFTNDGNQVKFTWDSISDLPATENSGVYKYVISYTRPDKTAEEDVLIGISYTFKDVTPNEEIKVKVKAIDHAGNEGNYSSELIWYGLPPVASVTNHEISFVDATMVPYQQQIELIISPVICSYYVIQQENLSDTNEPPYESVPYSNGWTFTRNVSAKQTYKYRIITYNDYDSEHLYSESEYTVTIPNNPPTKPTISILGLLTNGFLPQSSTTIAASSIDYDNEILTYTFAVKKNGVPITLNSQDIVTNTYQLSDLTDGAIYEIVVTVSDGEESISSDSVSFIVDVSGPIIRITPLPNENYVTSQSINVETTDSVSGLATLRYKWNEDGTFVDVPADGVIQADSGSNKLIVEAVDRAGNLKTNLSDDTSSDTMYVYRVDDTGPTVNFLTIQGQTYNNQTYITSNVEVFISFKFLEDQTAITRYRYGYLPQGLTLANVQINELPERQIQSLSSYQGEERITGQFVDGQTYYPILIVYDSLGNTTEYVSPTGFTVDGSGPAISDLSVSGLSSYGTQEYLKSYTSVDFSPMFTDLETQAVAKYGITDIPAGEPFDWYNSFTELKNKIPEISLVEGNTYYFVIQAENGVGLATRGYSSGFIVDTQSPVFSSIVGGSELPEGYGNYIQRTNTSLEVTWVVQDLSPISNYYYKIGTTVGTGDVSQGFVEADSSGWVLITNAVEEYTLVISRPGYTFEDKTYYVTIKAVDAAGNEATATTNQIQIDTTLPPVPTVSTDGIYVHEKNQIHFVIDMVNPEQDVVGYNYQIIDESSNVLVEWQLISTSELHYDLTHTGLNLVDGVKYYIAVKAEYLDGTSTSAGWANVIIDSTAPTNLVVESPTYASAQQLKVSWSATEDISSIRYWAKVGTTANGDDKLSLKLVGKVGQHVFKNISVLDGEVLYVTVMAENSSGLSIVAVSEPIIIDNTPPAIPLVIDDGMYTNIGTKLNASWIWSQDDPESGIESYQIALLKSRTVNENTIWIPLTANQKSYTYTQSLDNGSVYFVAIKVINRAGLSSIGYTDGILVDTTRPNPPGIDDHGNFVAYVDGLSTLTADAYGTDPQSGIQGYYYSLGTFDSPTSIINNQLITDSTVLGGNNLSLQLGKVYFFKVIAQNNAGDISAESISDGVMVVNGSEPKVQSIIDGGAYSIYNDKLFFIWSVNDTTIPIEYYEYCLITDQDQEITSDQWKVTQEKRVQINAEDVLGTGNTFTDGTTYYLAVRAVNKLLQQTIKLVSDGIKIDTTPPNDPILETDAYVTTNFKLKWSAADSHSGIAGYSYAIGTTRGGKDITEGWIDLDVSDLDEQDNIMSINQTVEVSNLTHGDTYYLSVKAKNGVGLWSNPVMSKVLIADLEKPTTPEVTATSSYTTSKLKINDISFSSSDLDSGIVGYRYDVVTSNNLSADLTTPTQKLPNFTSELNINDLDITNLSLSEGGTYYVAVQTLDWVGHWSPIGYSQPIIVDTLLPDLTFDTTETELVTNTGSLDVNWKTDEAGTLNYRLIVLNADGSHATNPEYTPITITTDCTGTFNFDVYMYGSYKYEMYQVDQAGNTTEPITQLVRYNFPPYVDIFSTNIQLYKGHSATFTLDASDGDGIIVEYQWVVAGVPYTK